jgi:hypothetical protein
MGCKCYKVNCAKTFDGDSFFSGRKRPWKRRLYAYLGQGRQPDWNGHDFLYGFQMMLKNFIRLNINRIGRGSKTVGAREV